MKLIQTQVLSSSTASIQLDSIPQTFTDLVLLYSFRDTGTNGTETVFESALSFNGNTANFSARTFFSNGSSVGSGSATRFSGWHPDAGVVSNTFGNTKLYIPNYTAATNKAYSVEMVSENNGTKNYWGIIAGRWDNTAAITSITLTTNGTSLAAGSMVSLYGILKGTSGGTTSP